MSPRAGPVDLVHDHDGPEPAPEGLVGHEAGLGHGTVDGIDQEQHGVDHREQLPHATEAETARLREQLKAVLAEALAR